MKPITPRASDTASPPSIHDVQKVRSSQRVAARAAIERDGPHPSELRIGRRYAAFLGCFRDSGTQAVPGANEAERERSHHGKGTKITMTKAGPLTAADGREAVPWESGTSGLELRTQPSGHNSWNMHRRRNGSVVRRTLGPLDALTVEEARVAARALLADSAAGDRAALTMPTVKIFARTLLAECAERLKPATRKMYAFNVRRWIEPAFGGRRADAIGAKDVRSRFDGIAATHPASAIWVPVAMSSLMKRAETLGLRPEDSTTRAVDCGDGRPASRRAT